MTEMKVISKVNAQNHIILISTGNRKKFIQNEANTPTLNNQLALPDPFVIYV